MAIGARSQSARTYLEKSVESFESAPLDQLILHAVKALRDTLPADSPTGLTLQNCSVAIVGIDTKFTILDETDQLKAILDQLPPPPAAQTTQAEPMETDAPNSGMDL